MCNKTQKTKHPKFIAYIDCRNGLEWLIIHNTSSKKKKFHVKFITKDVRGFPLRVLVYGNISQVHWVTKMLENTQKKELVFWTEEKKIKPKKEASFHRSDGLPLTIGDLCSIKVGGNLFYYEVRKNPEHKNNMYLCIHRNDIYTKLKLFPMSIDER